MPTPPSSLLAADGEDTEIPCLSSGSGMVNVEESPFERLIAQAHPPPGGTAGGEDLDDALVASLMAAAQEEQHSSSEDYDYASDNRGIIRPRRRQQQQQSPFSSPAPPKPNGRVTLQQLGSSYATVLAGSLGLLQIFLVWGSFLSNSWVNTYSRTPDLPVIDPILIHSTTPASLLSALAGAERQGAFLLLLVSSVFLPCLCMILCPAWTVTDHSDRQLLVVATNSRSGSSGRNWKAALSCLSPRFLFEGLIRWSFLVVFLLLILDIGTSSLEVVVRNETIFIFNRATGGLLCYTLGMGAALGVVLVLRLSRGASGAWGDYPHSLSLLPDDDGPLLSSAVRIPPRRAFQLPWRSASGRPGTFTDESSPSSEQQQQLLDPLLEEQQHSDHTPHDVAPPSTTTRTTATSSTMRNLQIEESVVGDVGHHQNGPARLHYCQKVILYEVGALSTFLWLPLLFCPLFQLDYDGLASEFMPNVTRHVRLWHFPILLAHNSRMAGTSLLIQWVLGSVLILTVYVIPVLTTVATITAWISSKPSTRHLCRLCLLYIQPMLCGIVFGTALMIAVPAFGPVLDHVLDEETSGICEQIQNITGEPCLTISGRYGLGSWSLLVQSFSLELFILLTIRWGSK